MVATVGHLHFSVSEDPEVYNDGVLPNTAGGKSM